MTYDLDFTKSSLKEWKKLDNTIKEQFKKKLRERLRSPCVISSSVSGTKDCYKIKLRQSGYRLVYKVIKKEIVVLVIAIGKRDKNLIYKKALQRLNNL